LCKEGRKKERKGSAILRPTLGFGEETSRFSYDDADAEEYDRAIRGSDGDMNLEANGLRL